MFSFLSPLSCFTRFSFFFFKISNFILSVVLLFWVWVFDFGSWLVWVLKLSPCVDRLGRDFQSALPPFSWDWLVRIWWVVWRCLEILMNLDPQFFLVFCFNSNSFVFVDLAWLCFVLLFSISEFYGLWIWSWLWILNCEYGVHLFVAFRNDRFL